MAGWRGCAAAAAAANSLAAWGCGRAQRSFQRQQHTREQGACQSQRPCLTEWQVTPSSYFPCTPGPALVQPTFLALLPAHTQKNPKIAMHKASKRISRLTSPGNAGRRKAHSDGKRHRAAAVGSGGRQTTAPGSQRRRPRSAGPGWTSAAAPGSGRPVASTAGGRPLTRPTCSRCSGGPATAALAAAVLREPMQTLSCRCKLSRRVLEGTILFELVHYH